MNFFFYFFAIGFLYLPDAVFAQDDPIKIRSVTIDGNESISQKELTNLLRQKPSNWLFRGAKLESRLVKLDALTLKNYFHSKGFLNVIIKESYLIENDVADIYFNIVEGKQFFVSKVEIHGNELISSDELKTILGVIVNEPYNPVRINENFALVENRYHDVGKLFAKLKIQDEISDSIAISISVEEGPNVIIHRTFIEEEKVDSVQVFRELKYKTGDRYSLSKMDLTKTRLRETGIFSMVNLIPVKVADSDSLVNIVIELNRFKQKEWNSVGGYEPVEFYEGTEPLPAIGGFVEWRDRSIFSSTTNFSTKLMVGIPWERQFRIPRLRYDISLFNNWLFLVRWPTRIMGFYETFINYQEENIDLIERFGMELSQQVKLDERSFFGNNAVWESFSDQEDSIENLQQRSISMRFHFDRKDDHLSPRIGYLFDIYLKSTGYFLGGKRDYLKADISMQAYIPLGSESIFALRLKSGNLWGWKPEDKDYSFEKFYLGGSTSMRGWDFSLFKKDTVEMEEETPDTTVTVTVVPKGDLFRLMTNIEYRIHIYKSIGLNLFVDGGILSDNVNAVDLSMLEWDGGIGITINTPLGPARLDYAVQFDNPRMRKLNLGVQYLF